MLTTYSASRSSMRGLLWAKGTSSAVQPAKAVNTAIPVLTFLRSLVITPFLMRLTIPGAVISECQPRSRFSSKVPRPGR